MIDSRTSVVDWGTDHSNESKSRQEYYVGYVHPLVALFVHFDINGSLVGPQERKRQKDQDTGTLQQKPLEWTRGHKRMNQQNTQPADKVESRTPTVPILKAAL